MFSCGQGLSPASLLANCKQTLKQNGLKPEKVLKAKEVNKARELRLVPMKRLRSRLGLDKYNVSAPIMEPKRVKIALQQNIGAKAVPIVKKGDKVSCGMQIAAAQSDALSVAIHASISGKVKEASDRYIIIER